MSESSPPLRIPHQPIELWGGMECTVNRVRDEYFDQSVRGGHHERVSDLDLIAGLGVRAVRYPVLWERTAPDGLQQADWRWADERLGRLRELGVRPIAGLVHHGSGPRHTSLVDPRFPDELAAYAGAVAERYPWIQEYTPVNEPLTTARFSGLYGHWYPHGRDELTFARVLLTECRAVVQAMAAIRRVNPTARLVQTDDLGKIYSTPRLAYQAAFENERRWLSWDLLCGAVDREHPMWGFLRWVGVEEAELAWFLDHPCPPDVVGINHYLTSERVLDEDMGPYPEDRWGGNSRETYADMEAVRVRAEGIGGWRVLVQEAWHRYQLPIALTEVHLGCSRDEQLRWLLEAWRTCAELRDVQGVDVQAVTAWSLFGAYDWNHLVTCTHGFYEPGVFDVRAPQPRPTALAWLMRQLASGEIPSHPVLETPGWWQRPERLSLRPLWTEPATARAVTVRRTPASANQPRPLLITGAHGTLGQAFGRICQVRGLTHRSLSRQDLDLADPASVSRLLDAARPWAVINAAAFVQADDAKADSDGCLRGNGLDATVLAKACATRGIRLVTFSSDLVFDGTKGAPYVESDPVAPLSVYGQRTAEADRRVLEADPTALLARTSACFSSWDVHNFVYRSLCALRDGHELVAVDDALVSPAYVPDLVHACLDLLLDGETGLWHLANLGSLTWADLARLTAEVAGVSARSLREQPYAAFGLPAERPRSSALKSERGWLLPTLEDALVRFLAECEPEWAPAAGPRDTQHQPLLFPIAEDIARRAV